jgi:hypothetical protein
LNIRFDFSAPRLGAQVHASSLAAGLVAVARVEPKSVGARQHGRNFIYLLKYLFIHCKIKKVVSFLDRADAVETGATSRPQATAYLFKVTAYFYCSPTHGNSKLDTHRRLE